MVAILVRLRFLVLWNTIKRSPWQAVGLAIGLLYALGVIGAALLGLAALSFTSLDFARTAVILVGSLVILGWAIVPLLTIGVDQTVEPAKLVTFPIPTRTLLIGMLASGALGIPGIATLIASLGSAVAWWRHPLAAVAALVSAVIAVVTCVLASRVTTTIASGLGSKRRYRELVGVLIFIPLMLLGPLILLLTDGIAGFASRLPEVADVLSWTPLGAVWAVPAQIALGDWVGAVLRLLVALATVGVLAVIWAAVTQAALVTPKQASSGGRVRGKLGFFNVFPGSPTGAVAARAMTYWLRDPRYARQLIVIPLVVVLAFFYGTLNGGDGPNAIANVAAPFVAFILALTIYTDISYDGTAFALHMSSGVSGRADRAGRVLAVATFSVPAVVLIAAITATITGTLGILPALLGLSLGVLLTGFGVASVTSARIVFPVPDAGDSPFKSSAPGAAIPSLIATFGTWGMTTVLSLPVVVLSIISFVSGSLVFGWLALVVGVTLGALFLVLGVRIGGTTLDRRAPELLVQLRK